MSSFSKSAAEVIPVALSMTVPAAAAVGILWPLNGALVRVRAQHVPLQDKLENDRQSRPTDIWGMLRRVKNYEGWRGVYKGLYAAATSVLSVVTAQTLWNLLSKGSLTPTAAATFGEIAYDAGVFGLIGLPMSVIVNRAIATPFRLPNKPMRALSALLSKGELANPFTLYSTSGFILLHILQSTPFTLVARKLGATIRFKPGHISSMGGRNWTIFVAWQVAGIILATPVEVILARLSLQEDLGRSSTVITEKEEIEDQSSERETLQRASSGDDVISRRVGVEPYLGILDCVRKMLQEEGYSSLYRGWLWTLAFNILGAIEV